MGGSRKRKGDDKDGGSIRVAPEPRIRQAPPQAPAATAAAIEGGRKDQDDAPATQASANARGGWCEQEAQAKGKRATIRADGSARVKMFRAIGKTQ